MLPAANRLRTSREFELVTKTGERVTSLSLVIYLKVFESSAPEPKVGLIVNSSVGGSVVRHRVSRQLRHLIKPHLAKLPKRSTIVIRVLRKRSTYNEELASLISKLVSKNLVEA